MSINRVAISGNLTRDAEIRTTQSGMAITGFGVAVNDRRKNAQTGEWEDCPNFIDCTAFGTRYEKLAGSGALSKGAKVAIEGKLRWSQWEAQDGSKRSKVEVIVDEIELMQRKQDGATRQAAPAQPQPQPAAYVQPQGYQVAPVAAAPQQQQFAGMPQPVAPNLYDEDIPF